MAIGGYHSIRRYLDGGVGEAIRGGADFFFLKTELYRQHKNIAAEVGN